VLDWLKTLVPGRGGVDLAESPHKGRGLGMGQPYTALYDYLDGRFADVVVMSFRDIEDLLGFPLPVSARRDARWWANDDLANAAHANAWLLAKRTATPNIPAASVVFERGYRSDRDARRA